MERASSAARPTSRPDLDNYVKSALDALNTIVVGNDARSLERTITTIFREVDFRALGQEDTPRGLEGTACLIEAPGQAVNAGLALIWYAIDGRSSEPHSHPRTE